MCRTGGRRCPSSSGKGTGGSEVNSRRSAGIESTGERQTRLSSEHSDAERKLFGTDTPEGAARFDRLSAERDSGYTGPLDSEGRRPDMSRPENQVMVAALDDMARRPAARMAAGN
jgi:hypothetical protein